MQDFYQSFKVYFFEDGLDKLSIKQAIKRNNLLTMTRAIDKNTKSVNTTVTKASIDDLHDENNDLVFDLIYYKTNDDEEQLNDEFHKVLLSTEKNILIIFGSFTNEKIPRAIKNIIYGRKSEFIFKPLQYEQPEIISIIDSLISTETVKVYDPRFSFFRGLFNEKRYSNFAGENYTCATKTKEYTDGINKCSDCRPIFLITEFEDLDLSADSVGSKLITGNNPMSFWIPGKYLKYDKWVEFFYKYCYVAIDKHKNTR